MAQCTKDQTERILENDRLAVYIADRIWTNLSRRNVEREDLRQAARLGLAVAAQRYDPERGEFAAFACKYIHGHVLDCITHADLIRLPRNISAGFSYERGLALLKQIDRHSGEADLEAKDIMASLTKQERAIILGEQDRASIRTELGLSRHEYEKARKAAVAKLRTCLGSAC